MKIRLVALAGAAALIKLYSHAHQERNLSLLSCNDKKAYRHIPDRHLEICNAFKQRLGETQA